MVKILMLIALSLALAAPMAALAEEETVDTTVRQTRTTGEYASDNPQKCQFSSNAGTAFGTAGALTPGMGEVPAGGIKEGDRTN